MDVAPGEQLSRRPVDPTPFDGYLLGWPVVAVAALLVGGVEYGLRWFRENTGEPTVG